MSNRSAKSQGGGLREKQENIYLPIDALQLPLVGVQEDPVRCYRLNHQWAKLIMGWVSYLTDIRGWAGATDGRHPGIVGVEQFLEGESCVMADCEQIEDCLETSPIIDAVILYQYSVQLEATQPHVDELNLAYDGTPQSIDPLIPATSPDADPDHDTALCYALEQWVRAYAGTKGAALSGLSNLGTWYQDTLSAIAGIFDLAPGYFLHLAGAEVGGCAPSSAAALAALDSEGALIEVACCLHDELRSSTVNETAFNAALLACKNSLTGDAGIIACLGEFDNTLSHVLTFFEAWGQILQRQAAGETFECACDNLWCYFYDFDVSPYNWTILEGQYVLSAECDQHVMQNETNEPAVIDISHGAVAYIAALDITLCGVGPGGNALMTVFADGEQIYQANHGDGAFTVPVEQSVGTIRVQGTRQFTWGIADIRIRGLDPDPLLEGIDCN